MKYFTTAVVALASATFAVAQQCNGINCFNIPEGGYQTAAGATVNISWTPSTSGTISLQLREGNAAYLSNSSYIVQNYANSGQYTWNVPSDIIRGSSYAIEIIDDSDPTKVNYTPQFLINSDVLYSSTTSGATSSTTSGSASASSGSMTMTTSGSTTGSASMTTSGSTTAASGSTTTSGTTTSSRTTTTTGSSTGGAHRATAVAGFLGVVALGALAL